MGQSTGFNYLPAEKRVKKCQYLECAVGWKDFEKKKQQIIGGPQFQNFMLPFNWSQGLRKFKLLPKNQLKKERFLSLQQGGTISSFFLKLKMKINNKNVFPCTDQKQLCPFWEEEKKY